MTKMSSFLSPYNRSPEEVAQPAAFSGLPLMPGTDLVITLPAANGNNSVLSHSVQYKALILFVDSPVRRAKSSQETQEQHVSFPP